LLSVYGIRKLGKTLTKTDVMKFTFTLLLLAAFISASSQKWKLTANYSLGMPQQEMGHNIQAVHSLQAGFMYELPGCLNRLFIGVEGGVGGYADKRIDQTFQSGSDPAFEVPVSYFSNVANIDLQMRWDLAGKDKMLIPYLQAKGGNYTFFSNIYIEDPNDPDGCHALQQKNIINDNTMYWSAGAGLQINVGVFSCDKENRQKRTMLDFSVNTIRGGQISYINTKQLLDAQSVTTSGKPLSVEFINASTQEIHEHTVAQVYTSPLRLFEIKAGVTVKL
jgi:hypothetical protein